MTSQKLSDLLKLKSLPGLDGFRMLAVMSVVFAHAGHDFIFTARHGVAGFFVLSGFLITWLLLREHKNTDTISFKSFYLRRALRIFPAYYAFVAVSIAWDLYSGNDNIREMILPSLFYFVNYHNALDGHSSASVAHLWSLAVEEQFYFLWPLMFLVLIGRSKKTVIRFLVVAIISVMIWRSVTYSLLDFGQSYAYNAFDTRFDNLAIGCLLAFLLEREQFCHLMEKLCFRQWFPLVTLGLLGLSRMVPLPDYEYGPAFTIDAFLLAILLVQLVKLSNQPLLGWLNHRWAIYLGVISYPIYLWHVWGLQAGDRLYFLPESFRFPAGVAISVMLAALSYHLLEKRFLRLKHKFEKQKVKVADRGLSAQRSKA